MPRPSRPPLERLAAKVAVDDNGCWIWLGAKIRAGYGHFHVDGKFVKTHRWTYEHFVGPIPDGLVIDHLCKVVACCNPWHLEPVTQLENIRRSDGNGSKTHCRQGHPFDADNTIWTVRGGSSMAAGQLFRKCRICRDAIQARRDAKRREARGQLPGHCRQGHDLAVVGLARNGRWSTCAECRRLSNQRHVAKRAGRAA